MLFTEDFKIESVTLPPPELSNLSSIEESIQNYIKSYHGRQKLVEFITKSVFHLLF